MKRYHYFFGILVFLFSFIVYIKTLCPTVSFGDSGELVTAAYTLGVAHPPGSPTWCILSKVFTYLPFGSIAYRINLFSAFFASATIFIVYFIAIKIGKTLSPLARCLSAIVSSLLIAFSYCFWSYAVVAEVYSLNTFFTALVILILLYLRERRTRKYLYLLAFIFGLAIGNHYTILLILPAIFIFFLIERVWVFERKIFFLAIFFLLTGLSVFLYLPIRSFANPPVDFCDPETLKSFIKVILRQAYVPFEITHSLKGFLAHFDVYIRSLGKQFTLFIIWLGIPGLCVIAKKDPRFSLFSLIVFYAYSLGILSLSGSSLPPPVEEVKHIATYIPSYLIYGLWMGAAAGWLVDAALKINRIFSCIITAFVLIFPFFPFKANYFENDKSNYTFAYDYGMEVLEGLDPGALLITSGDQPFFILLYLHYVEGVRPDVAIISGQLLPAPWYIKEVKYKYPFISDTLKIKRKQKDIYSDIHEVNRIIDRLSLYVPIYCTAPDLVKPDYLLCEGFIYRFNREKKLPDYPEKLMSDIRNWDNENIFKDKEARDCFARFYNHLSYYFFSHNLATRALMAQRDAMEISLSYFISPDECFYLGWCYQRINEIDRAIELYNLSLRLEPKQVRVHNNLALAYIEKSDYDSAIFHFKEALKIDPQYETARANLSKIEQQIQNKTKKNIVK